MYPPSPQYSRLPTDPEGSKSDIQASKPWSTCAKFTFTRSFAVALSAIFVVALLTLVYSSSNELRAVQIPLTSKDPVVFPNNTFIFNQESRPPWVDAPFSEPIVLRIAVMTRFDAFERRQAVREAVFQGVRKQDVRLDYRFFIGRAPHTTKGSSDRRLVEEENQKFNDIVMLEEIDDIPERLSEKRYAALKWGGSVSNGTYDYFITLDSDTFVRFAPLSRRLLQLYGEKKINPREDPVLIGRMASHLTYFLPKVLDGSKDAKEQDETVKGPWFSYPAGIGYMLSSSLVNILLSADPPLPHHIHYPSDDVMIGAWIAALRLFHDKTIEWESTVEHSNEPVHRVYPKPFLPFAIDTLIIDDIYGWHDFPNRGGHDAPISWDSVCVHHITASEMLAIRERLEFLGEWEL